ncbi:MAG: protein-tyrosine-phosphatase [Flavobacteriaceae bacterium]
METKKSVVYPQLKTTIKLLDTESILADRKKLLQPLIAYVKDKLIHQHPINLNFICTHNSRRSHLSQVWAQTMASYIGLKNVTCYSGGTEATALFPMAAETLESTGFQIRKLSETSNPIYSIKYAEDKHPIIGFSKTYDDDFNPKLGFGAIMTCDSANEACPMIIGAEKRFPITYKDPKAFDRTPQQAQKYMERSLQIATELKYVFRNATT